MRSFQCSYQRNLLLGVSLFVAVVGLLCLPVNAQQTDPKTSAVVVQPGAPGRPTKVLAASTRAKLPPRSAKDVEFMQGMITHHAQAVEMVVLIEPRTANKDLRLVGARISKSQLDEMAFMKRWLEARSEPISPSMEGMNGHAMDHHELMPGMLTATQMEALRKAKGAEFDRLFLEGMIQHHNGALTMVEELFNSAGAGQDAELFSLQPM